MCSNSKDRRGLAAGVAIVSGAVGLMAIATSTGPRVDLERMGFFLLTCALLLWLNMSVDRRLRHLEARSKRTGEIIDLTLPNSADAQVMPLRRRRPS